VCISYRLAQSYSGQTVAFRVSHVLFFADYVTPPPWWWPVRMSVFRACFAPSHLDNDGDGYVGLMATAYDGAEMIAIESIAFEVQS
jgi:hypothetical protein